MTDLKDKVIFGGLYHVLHNNWNNDQSYHLAVPIVDDKGNLWMQDTYQISFPSMKKGESKFEACVRRMVEFGNSEHSWLLKHISRNYYYKNQEKIHSEGSLDRYELIADLRDYRQPNGDEWKDYRPEDVVHGVKLYFEHGYSWSHGAIGIIIVRKDAIKNNVQILHKCTGNLWGCIKYPESWNHRAEEVRNALEFVGDNAESHEAILNAKLALAMHEKIMEVRDECNKFYNDAKKELGL